MKHLDRILQGYLKKELPSLGRTKPPLGAIPQPDGLTQREKTALLTELSRVQKDNATLLWTGVMLLLVLFCISVGVILTHLDNPNIVKVVSGALGISAATCVRWLISLWERKTAVEQLLRLAVALEGDALTAVITVLAERGRASRSSRSDADHDAVSTASLASHDK